MAPRRELKAVLFDFDGTLSTLRAGWEEVMLPFMKESILGSHSPTEQEEKQLTADITVYIDQSTGIQTIFQMQWLADKVREQGWNPVVQDIWEYKAEYNRRLLEQVNTRIRQLEQGELRAEDYLMKGSLAFLHMLRERNIDMYIASGTDALDVQHEAEVLGVSSFFQEIAGAPVGRMDCSKEKVIHTLIEVKGLNGGELAVIGDGKVEIRLAKESGALAIGLASDEAAREGINSVKQERLLQAGADYIAGDFQNIQLWSAWLGWDVQG